MQKIIVDMTPGYRMPTINFSQGDVGTQFAVDLRSRFGDSLPASATVTVQATKPSGLGFSVAATSVTNGVAVFTTTAVMTDEAGRFPAEIKVVKDSLTMFTANFNMDGEATTHPEGTIDGQQDTLLPELTQLVERVEDAASSVLDMTVEAETLAAGSQATYSYDEDTNTATFGIPQGEAGAGAAGVTASAYSSSSTYAVGDYVIHNSNLYRCTTAITTAEAFTAAHWTQVVLGDDVSDLKSDFNNITNVITSKNLLNKSASGVGLGKLVVPNSSDVYDSNDYNATDYIPISVGEHITLSAHQGVPDQSAVYFRTVAIYNENKGIITQSITSGVNAYVKDYVVADANAAYMRASISKTVWDSSNIMIEVTEDGTETEYQPYFDPYYQVKVSSLPTESVLSNSDDFVPTSRAVYEAIGYSPYRFVGKKITALGDSITYGGTWFSVLENALNTTIVNCGNSGRRLIDLANGDYVNDIPLDTELVLVMAGMNDWANNTPLGTKNLRSTDLTTLYGGCNVLIQKIMQRVPNAKIINLGVTFGFYPNRSAFTDKYGLYNNLGMTSIDYGRAVSDMFKLNGIEAYCIGEFCGWNENNISSYCINDGAYIHPNSSGGNLLGNAILRLLK